MHERLERLVEVDIAHIAERLGDKARVEKVHTSVFRAADVLVYGQHFVDILAVERLIVVVRVGIAQVVPTRANERVESVGVAARGSAAHRASHVHKLFALTERRFAVGREIDVVGKFDGQILFGNGNRAAVVAMDNRDRRAPVTLTGNRPVAQAVVDLQLASFSSLAVIAFFASSLVSPSKPGVLHT